MSMIVSTKSAMSIKSIANSKCYSHSGSGPWVPGRSCGRPFCTLGKSFGSLDGALWTVGTLAYPGRLGVLGALGNGALHMPRTGSARSYRRTLHGRCIDQGIRDG